MRTAPDFAVQSLSPTYVNILARTPFTKASSASRPRGALVFSWLFKGNSLIMHKAASAMPNLTILLS